MLDEATKKFIAWSSVKYLSLAAALVTEQENLGGTNLPESIEVEMPINLHGAEICFINGGSSLSIRDASKHDRFLLMIPTTRPKQSAVISPKDIFQVKGLQTITL